MKVERQHLWARVLLAAFFVAGIGWLWKLDRQAKISTDVLDLIPQGNRQPELGLVRLLASERQGRVVLLAVEIPGTSGAAAERRVRTASQALVEALRRSGCFEEVLLMADRSAWEGLAKEIYDRRLNLLLPQWLGREFAAHAAAGASAGPAGPWIAERAALVLERYLAKPEAVAFQDLIPSDPLLLMPGLVDRLPSAATPGGAKGALGLVWALQRDNPLSEAGQQPVFSAVEDARRAMTAADSEASVRWTGVARFAAMSRANIEKELSWLNVASLAVIAAVAAVCLSRPLRSLNLVPPIIAGFLGAWVVTTMCFERVHVLVFVVGSLLGGVAVDYGFYLYLQPPVIPGEQYLGKLRRLLKPLLASALTTVLGFSLLLASELPLIRQLGVFVSAGLLCALAAAILWFGQLRDFHLPARPIVCARFPDSPTMRALRRAFLCLGLLLAFIGPWFLRWQDNIHQLEIPAPALRDNDTAIRRLFGEGDGNGVFITRGDTPAAARAAWGRFAGWEASMGASAPFSLALVVPDEADWRSLDTRLADLGDFEGALRSALLRHGFDDSAFGAFFADWKSWKAANRPDYGELARTFVASLHGPASLLASFSPGVCWYASVVPQAPSVDPPPALETMSLSQLETLNRLFSQYRLSALRLSSIGLALVGLSVLALYGIRRGIRVFSIPAGACLCSFGLLGLAGQTLNLFHLLGAFLGVCLSHNYAIFSTENSLRGEDAPPSIRLSAFTTALSFSVLSLSRIPVVAALGTSVSLIVAFALVIVELQAPIPGATGARRDGALQLESR